MDLEESNSFSAKFYLELYIPYVTPLLELALNGPLTVAINHNFL